MAKARRGRERGRAAARPRRRQGRAKLLVTPRVLLFLERGGRWLFLEGGPAKWFAGRLNGLGGSVEAGEDARAAAFREAREECGLAPSTLRLTAVVHVATGTDVITMTNVRRRRRTKRAAAPVGVLLFVFVGKLRPGALHASAEGRLVWHPLESIGDPAVPFLDDVRALLPRVARHPAGAPPLFLTSNA